MDTDRDTTGHTKGEGVLISTKENLTVLKCMNITICWRKNEVYKIHQNCKILGEYDSVIL